ncbi:MAG: tetratricopeptide repeat protein, partial [Candidatus Omnitrophica bacterium]|nr:tetratricopeptide repeat protein [Candidatus Omnitrophota bacterium]
MRINIFRNKISVITPAVCVLMIASFCAAEEAADTSLPNYGYLQYGSIPEKKKETVLVFSSGEEDITQVRSPISSVLQKNKEEGKESGLSPLQSQAREYRSQGLEMQQVGNLEGAMSFYQKAVELDPGFAMAYNDLGILYEAVGDLDRAESCYLRAVNLDKEYVSPYSNLALLYENKREFRKAAYYWEKRIEVGSSDDIWTKKAEARLDDLCK